MDVSKISPQSTPLIHREQTSVELPLQNQEARRIATDLTSDRYTPTIRENFDNSTVYEKVIMNQSFLSEDAFINMMNDKIKEDHQWFNQLKTYKNYFFQLYDETSKLYSFLKENAPEMIDKQFDFGYKNSELIVVSDELSDEQSSLIKDYITNNTSLKESIFYMGEQIYSNLLTSKNSENNEFFVKDFHSFVETHLRSTFEEMNPNPSGTSPDVLEREYQAYKQASRETIFYRALAYF